MHNVFIASNIIPKSYAIIVNTICIQFIRLEIESIVGAVQSYVLRLNDIRSTLHWIRIQIKWINYEYTPPTMFCTLGNEHF